MIKSFPVYASNAVVTVATIALTTEVLLIDATFSVANSAQSSTFDFYIERSGSAIYLERLRRIIKREGSVRAAFKVLSLQNGDVLKLGSTGATDAIVTLSLGAGDNAT